MSTHTPGPWHLRADHFDDGTPYFEFEAHPSKDDPRGYYDEATKRGFQMSGICNEADARLIAAAPDMLAALKEARLQIEYLHEKFAVTGSGSGALVKIVAAISKAEGKPCI